MRITHYKILEMNELELELEAKEFDAINDERSKNIQSIIVFDDRVESYFYKNTWRYPITRDYAFGTVLNQFSELIKNEKNELNILEIGCGNGWFSINANLKNKHKWFSFDISKVAIDNANKSKEKYGLTKNNYAVESLENFATNEKFDYVVCVNSLHHLTDLELFYTKVRQYLKPEGKLFINDVCSDYFDTNNAILVLIIRTILQETEKINYFEKFRTNDFDKQIEGLLLEWQNETDDIKQSVHDHAHTSDEILWILNNQFMKIDYKLNSSFLMRLLGGLRGKNEDIENLIKQLIRIEKSLLERKLVQPYTYTFIGKI